MNLETNNATDSAYQNGKQTVLEVLERVLTSMKSKGNNITARTFNKILDEVYEKVKTEVN